MQRHVLWRPETANIECGLRPDCSSLAIVAAWACLFAVPMHSCKHCAYFQQNQVTCSANALTQYYCVCSCQSCLCLTHVHAGSLTRHKGTYVQSSTSDIHFSWRPGCVGCRRHKKRKQEEMQFIKGNRKHQGGYSSGGGLTSKGPIMDGENHDNTSLHYSSKWNCWLTQESEVILLGCP